MDKKFEIIILIVLVFLISATSALNFEYHKYEALTNVLTNFTPKYPQLHPRLHSIGKSARGRNLWVVEVTAVKECCRIGIPNVKLIGNIHGNEAVGRELLLHFLEYLGDSYGKDPSITWLMENTRIHVLPSMNPDGFEISSEGICLGEHGRYNSRSLDLNRNFPDFYNKNPYPTQPEATAIRRWMKEIPFILSASLHGGALVANYPFDTVKEMKWEKLLRQLMDAGDPEQQQKLRDDYIASLPWNPPSISADDDVFVHLAKVYANRHPTMHLGLPCPDSTKNFTGGITNGAAWYPFAGGMQDFNYAMHGCMELTLEISCCKYPHARELPTLWEANKYALLDLVKQAHRGVRGIIFDVHNRKPVASANLKISGRNMTFTTSRNGEFWRILLPGKYELQIIAEGYHPESVAFEVLNYGEDQPKLTTLQVPLTNSSFPRTTPTTTTRSTSSSSISTTLLANSTPNNSKTNPRSKPAFGQSVDDAPIQLKSTAGRTSGGDPDYMGNSRGTSLWFGAFLGVSIVFPWVFG